MIVFEDGIEVMVGQMPTIGGFTVNFHWGNQDELNRYIALNAQPYPIIWLISGNEKHLTNDEEVERSCRFIIAVRELNVSQLNDYRLKNSYLLFLNPLVDRLIEGLTKSSILSMPDRSFTIEKLPNYSEQDKNKTIDLWDAVTIDCNVRMINNCQNTIKWQS
tara:strand:+ start:6662 stop:7147 length:486 start_codon:yes stop_codon:yes gene_type:complete